MRSWLIRVFPWHLLIFHAAVLAGAAIIWFRRRGSPAARVAELAAAVVIMAMLELGVSTLADACETRRHLFLFHALTDVAICLAFGSVVRWRGREVVRWVGG